MSKQNILRQERTNTAKPALEAIKAKHHGMRCASILQLLSGETTDDAVSILRLAEKRLTETEQPKEAPKAPPKCLRRKSDGKTIPYTKQLFDTGKFDAVYDPDLELPSSYFEAIEKQVGIDAANAAATREAQAEYDLRKADPAQAVESAREEAMHRGRTATFDAETADRPALFKFIEENLPEGEKLDRRKSDEQLRAIARELSQKLSPAQAA